MTSATPGRQSLANSVRAGLERPRSDWHRPTNQQDGIKKVHAGAGPFARRNSSGTRKLVQSSATR